MCAAAHSFYMLMSPSSRPDAPHRLIAVGKKRLPKVRPFYKLSMHPCFCSRSITVLWARFTGASGALLGELADQGYSLSEVKHTQAVVMRKHICNTRGVLV